MIHEPTEKHMSLKGRTQFVAVTVCYCFAFVLNRNVKVSGLNDSYYVGLSIYNTVICCVVAVPLSFLAVSSIGVTFALVSGFLLLCITASLCLLFFPKVIKCLI